MCKTLLKRKTTATQNLWSVKTKLWKNFITTIKKTIEIFYLHSSKGLKKSISQTSKLLQWKHQRYKEDLESYKNFSVNETKKQWHTFINLRDEKCINDPVSIANIFNNCFTSVAEIVHSKIEFSNKSFKNLLSSEINDSFLITIANKEEIYKITIVSQ